MSGESWKALSAQYKDKKHMPIDDTPMPHKKKKKKKNKRSNHKHKYIPAIYYTSGKDGTTYGFHCKHCGRVKDMSYAGYWVCKNERLELFKQEHPDYVEIILPENWSWWKDKNVPIKRGA